MCIMGGDDDARSARNPDLEDLEATLGQLALHQPIFVFAAGLLGTSKVLADTIDAEEMVEFALVMVAPG